MWDQNLEPPPPCDTVRAFGGITGRERPTLRRTAEWLKLLRDDCKTCHEKRQQRRLRQLYLHMIERSTRKFDIADGHHVQLHYVDEIAHLEGEGGRWWWVLDVNIKKR